MKRLLIMRHGKAEASSANGDKGRALTTKGVRQAEVVGVIIRDTIGVPDLVVASNALRAKQTAKSVVEQSGYSGMLVLNSDIYEASVSTLLKIVASLPPNADTVLLVGHNPGFEELVPRLTENSEAFVSMPTSGLVVVEFDQERWSDIGKGTISGIYSGKD